MRFCKRPASVPASLYTSRNRQKAARIFSISFSVSTQAKTAFKQCGGRKKLLQLPVRPSAFACGQWQKRSDQDGSSLRNATHLLNNGSNNTLVLLARPGRATIPPIRRLMKERTIPGTYRPPTRSERRPRKEDYLDSIGQDKVRRITKQPTLKAGCPYHVLRMS
jgi:hypothetical protein